MPKLQSMELLAVRILVIRGQRVMVDADLAELYGVSTKAFNQVIKRNPGKFPYDFMFQLTVEEKHEVVTHCDHLQKLKFSRTNPFVFTEHGAIQAANILNSPQAIYIVRASAPFSQQQFVSESFVGHGNFLAIYPMCLTISKELHI